ncbi:RNA polymerase sigma factor [Halovulum sp. GXIMD14793]
MNTRRDLIRVFRADHGRLLAALLAQFRDFDLAEDALQAAFAKATEVWPQQGQPERPAAWLMTVARRHALDRLRKTARQGSEVMRRTITMLTEAQDIPNKGAIPDERLRLIFTCCHPALAQEAQVALTLRTLGGLSTAEIARAFLSREPAIAKRLTRAKTKIRDAGIPYEVPEPAELPHRLPQVLAVIYLIYNESYSAFEGTTLTRADLAEEALHLARITFRLRPLPETQGLLALLLLHDARRPARGQHEMIPLEAQDRTLWDRDKINKGRTHLLHALAHKRPGAYQIQAAISAVHTDAADWDATDWKQIAGLYKTLSVIAPSDVVTLNHAVALCQAGDLTEAEALITTLAGSLVRYQPFYAARAELYRRQGQLAAACTDLDKAIELSRNTAETRWLQRRRDALGIENRDAPGQDAV